MEVIYGLNKEKSRKINEWYGKKKVVFNQKIDLQSQNIDID